MIKFAQLFACPFQEEQQYQEKGGAARVVAAKTRRKAHLLVVFPPISIMQVQSLVISLLLKGRTLTATFTDDILLGSAITGSGSYNRWTAHWPLNRQSFQRKSLYRAVWEKSLGGRGRQLALEQVDGAAPRGAWGSHWDAAHSAWKGPTVGALTDNQDGGKFWPSEESGWRQRGAGAPLGSRERSSRAACLLNSTPQSHAMF